MKPQRRCKICRQKFTPAFDNVRWCCPEHGAQFALVELEKKRTKQRKAMVKKEREAWRKRKEAVKPLKHWIDLTQRAVNDVCRETALVNGEGCISCGAKTANAWHAGHYRTTAAAGHLRFTRININLQCDACNLHKSGNIEAYRIALVARYGETAVQELENNNTPHRWTREELKEIRLTALAELRALKKREAA
ncbi:recombination protein NinG [Trabulsiella odontotermitis]|uniref:recombination protein NinG n=1 Tax=Trabulsiella odontotermitis TaxID=379893 RepID=UPI0006BA4821|nr:recombination protein NinG [Trabulsiella odontotermitis]